MSVFICHMLKDYIMYYYVKLAVDDSWSQLSCKLHFSKVRNIPVILYSYSKDSKFEGLPFSYDKWNFTSCLWCWYCKHTEVFFTDITWVCMCTSLCNGHAFLLLSLHTIAFCSLLYVNVTRLNIVESLAHSELMILSRW